MDISVMGCGGTFSVVYGNSITCNSANEKFSKIVKIFCAFYIKHLKHYIYLPYRLALWFLVKLTS